MMSYLLRISLLSGKIISIGLILWVASGNAFASPGSLNAGVSYCNTISDTLPLTVKDYALTGNVSSGFKPTHSRAWYADVLGLKDVLETLIAKDQSLIENEELLRVAATVENSNSLEVFLAHGADPNATVKSETTPTSPPLLLLAMYCERGINVLNLLAAGASVYASDTQGLNAMSVASVGDPLTQPWGFYEEGMILLLAAGYDPRCPINTHGTMSPLSLAKDDLANYEKQVSGMTNMNPKTKLYGKKLREIVTILQGVEAIQEVRSPGAPRCSDVSK
ncbi:MAG: hypothetical protein ACREHG_03000 [Candidatus Saccharimonadales bacterium]